MPSFCVVASCEYKYASYSSNISFHKFPFHKPNHLADWIKFTDRGPDWSPSRWSSICSRHFLPGDFRKNTYRKCLRANAVPSIKIKHLDYSANYLNMNEAIDVFGGANENLDLKSLAVADNNLIKQQNNILQEVIQFQSSTANLSQNQSVLQSAPLVDQPSAFTVPNLPKKVLRKDCRLCAKKFLNTIDAQMRSMGDANIVSMFHKCFPTTTIEMVENLPDNICLSCFTKLRHFSVFIDKVLLVQNERNSMEDHEDSSVVKPTIIIKQEPVLVKQEIVESYKSTLVPSYVDNYFVGNTSVEAADQPIEQFNQNFFSENDAFCEFCDACFINNSELKNHIINFHSDNPREITNSCEIMEIITLEENFIDLDEAENETNCENLDQLEYNQKDIYIPPVLKVELLNDYEMREFTTEAIELDHNYNKPPGTMEVQKINVVHCSILRPLKQEEPQSTVAAVEFYCTQCSLQFPTQSKHNDHIQKMHSIQSQFLCTICQEDCKTIRNLIIHRRTVHQFNGKSIRRSRNSVNKCNNCLKTFFTKLAFKNHARYTCRRKCENCHKYFANAMFDGHTKQCQIKEIKIENQTSITADLPLDSPTFGIPNPALPSISEVLLPSLPIKKRRVRLLYDDKSYDDLDSKASANYECELCGRCYTRRSNLFRHFAHHRPREQWNQQCKHCHKVFDKVYDMWRHLRAKLCPKLVEMVDKSVLEAAPAKCYICAICLQQFDSYQKFRLHETVHSGLKPYACNVCGKSFRVANNLYQHKVTHLDEKKYPCTLCSKVFKRSVGLNQHLRGFHYKIKPHTCPVCKYSYALKADMTRCKHSSLKIINEKK